MIDAELAQGFKEESLSLTKELKGVVERLETPSSEFPAALLQEFSQKIDRIMGAAKTLSLEAPEHQGLRRIATFAEICKYIGYKVAEQKQVKIIPIVAAFWSDVLAATEDLLAAFEDESKAAQITRDFVPVLTKRLEWLKGKVASAAQGSATATQAEIDKLVAGLLK